jgi:hypothetical protein
MLKAVFSTHIKKSYIISLFYNQLPSLFQVLCRFEIG